MILLSPLDPNVDPVMRCCIARTLPTLSPAANLGKPFIYKDLGIRLGGWWYKFAAQNCPLLFEFVRELLARSPLATGKICSLSIAASHGLP
jgi:hypothetical protein